MSVRSGAHLGLDVFRVLSVAVALLAGLPGVLRLLQVHIVFHRDRDDLPGLSSLARLRSPWSNIQQLGQEYSLLHPHRVLTIYCLCCAARVRTDGHRKTLLDAKMGVRHWTETWSFFGGEGVGVLECHHCSVHHDYNFWPWCPKWDMSDKAIVPNKKDYPKWNCCFFFSFELVVWLWTSYSNNYKNSEAEITTVTNLLQKLCLYTFSVQYKYTLTMKIIYSIDTQTDCRP